MAEAIISQGGSSAPPSSPSINFTFNTASQVETVASFSYYDTGLEKILYLFHSESNGLLRDDFILIQNFSDGANLQIAYFDIANYLDFSIDVVYNPSTGEITINFILTASDALDSEIKTSVTELARNTAGGIFEVI